MPRSRVLAEPGHPGLYHVCSRVVDKRVIFGDRERREFMRMIKGGAVFAGVDVVSWCLMGNHFHLLVRVQPFDAEALSDEEVLARMEWIYPEPRMRHFRGVWERIESVEERRLFLGRFRSRMGVLSEFVKTLKQRFTQWFNRRENREGTLWEGRFFSVLLAHNETDDGSGLGLLARFVAGYIDLNPVRAKLARDAGESDWSSYGAARRGDTAAVDGIRILWGEKVADRAGSRRLLEIHREMLERASFRNMDGEGDWQKPRGTADSLSGHGAGVEGVHSEADARVFLSGKPPPQDSRPRHAEIGKAIAASDPGVEISRRIESALLSRMGERCEALVKGRALGRGWVLSQVG